MAQRLARMALEAAALGLGLYAIWTGAVALVACGQ